MKIKSRLSGIIIAVIMAVLVLSPVYAENTYASDKDSAKAVSAAESEDTVKTENAKKVPVLAYHYVGNSDSGKLQISRWKFEKQCNWIKKCGYKTLTMEEFVEWYEGKRTIPKKSVLITFDDGAQNVVKYAVPILKKNKQHATMFITGKWVGTGSFVTKSMVKKLQKSSVIDVESHGYAIHNRDHGRMPAHKWSVKKLKADCVRMNKDYGCTVLCYPWGATSKNLRKALKQTGVYSVAFTYARVNQFQGVKSKYAKRSDHRYKIPRITISAYDSWRSIQKWVKP